MDRLKHALLRNGRRRQLPAFLEQLERETDLRRSELRSIDLAVSDTFSRRVEARIDALRKSGDLRDPGPLDRQGFARTVECALRGESSELWIMFAHWPDLGAFAMRSERLAAAALPLLELDGDTVYGGTRRLSRLLLLDYTRDTDTYRVAWNASGG